MIFAYFCVRTTVCSRLYSNNTTIYHCKHELKCTIFTKTQNQPIICFAYKNKLIQKELFFWSTFKCVYSFAQVIFLSVEIVWPLTKFLNDSIRSDRKIINFFFVKKYIMHTRLVKSLNTIWDFSNKFDRFVKSVLYRSIRSFIVWKFHETAKFA